MGQFLRVNGDYNIKTIEEGRITLDTGPGVGQVLVTGNLVVQGDTLTISAQNLNVNDNIITVNYGETGNGVSLIYAGMQVDRGTGTPNSIVWNENLDAWQIGAGAEGSYSFANSALKVTKIIVDPDTVTDTLGRKGTLTLIGASATNGVVSVRGTVDYKSQVVDADDIPNKAYVDLAVQNNPTYQIVRANTRVVAFDTALPLDPLLNFPPAVGPYTSQPLADVVGVVVDGDINTQFYKTYIEMQDLRIEDNEIKSNITGQNLKLSTLGTDRVEINYALQLEQRPSPPTYTPNYTVIYGADPEIGRSGVFFANDDADPNHRYGELISKKKALLFSMIF